MALTREKKTEIINTLKDIAAKSESVVFVNFHGLSVSDTVAMRKELRDKNVSYLVAKKSLIKKVFSDSKTEGDLPELDGELAICYGEDPIAPASGIAAFVKKHTDAIAILGGIFEGRFQNKEEMTVIASIPPLEVLYGQFVNVINSPIAGLVVALDQIAQKKEA